VLQFGRAIDTNPSRSSSHHEIATAAIKPRSRLRDAAAGRKIARFKK
jgi:hypothetical protein